MKRLQLLTQVVGTVTLVSLALVGLASLARLAPVVGANSTGVDQVGLGAGLDGEINDTVNYQGILRDSEGGLITGSYDITIAIFDELTGGQAQYTTTIKKVPVRDGLFNVVLGDDEANPLPAVAFADKSRYIGLSLDGGKTWFAPRQHVHTVPWAISATNASNATHAVSADSATSADTATTLVQDATVHGFTSTNDITVNGDLTVTGTIEGASSGPQFIWPKIVIKDSQSCTVGGPWRVEISDSRIPADATAVILEAYGRSTGGMPWMFYETQDGRSYTILAGAEVLGPANLGAWFNQGVYPVSNRVFFWRMSDSGGSGFNQHCILAVIGYYR